MLGIKGPGHLLALYSFWLFCLTHGSAKTPFSAATDRLAGFMLVAREKTVPVLKCELGTWCWEKPRNERGPWEFKPADLPTAQRFSQECVIAAAVSKRHYS